MATFIQIIFTFVLHHFLFGKLQARAIGAGECPQNGTTKIHCCPNYSLNGDECEECPPGYMGENCGVSCPSGWYGRFCLNRCACEPPLTCDPVIGCTCKGTKCQIDKAATVSPPKGIPESTQAPDNGIETTIYHLITRRIHRKYISSERNAQSSRSICTSNYFTSFNHLKYITGLKTGIFIFFSISIIFSILYFAIFLFGKIKLRYNDNLASDDFPLQLAVSS